MRIKQYKRIRKSFMLVLIVSSLEREREHYEKIYS